MFGCSHILIYCICMTAGKVPLTTRKVWRHWDRPDRLRPPIHPFPSHHNQVWGLTVGVIWRGTNHMHLPSGRALVSSKHVVCRIWGARLLVSIYVRCLHSWFSDLSSNVHPFSQVFYILRYIPKKLVISHTRVFCCLASIRFVKAFLTTGFQNCQLRQYDTIIICVRYDL